MLSLRPNPCIIVVLCFCYHYGATICCCFNKSLVVLPQSVEAFCIPFTIATKKTGHTQMQWRYSVMDTTNGSFRLYVNGINGDDVEDNSDDVKVPVTETSAVSIMDDNTEDEVKGQMIDESSTTTLKASSTTLQIDNNTGNNKKQRRVAVLVCPAQFCVPADYESLFTILKNETSSSSSYHTTSTTTNNNNPNQIQIGTCQVCDLPRTEWIKVAQQLPTMEFINAQLPIEPTLYWYFQAIEKGLANIITQEHQYRSSLSSSSKNDNIDFSICIIGHSIGGWVARAYLGGLSLSSSALYNSCIKQYISSFITLGTPHISPSTALVDQTRGLLAAIEASASCTPQSIIEQSLLYRKDPIEITCVCSSAISGTFLTTNVEEIVAASSYLPLTGKGSGIIGDGIVPIELAYLDPPAKRITVTQCTRTQQPIRHCHVLPTPWNLLNGYAPSIELSADTFPSYISDGVVQQWISCIR